MNYDLSNDAVFGWRPKLGDEAPFPIFDTLNHNQIFIEDCLEEYGQLAYKCFLPTNSYEMHK